jgi:uncharacterized Zn finger protein
MNDGTAFGFTCPACAAEVEHTVAGTIRDDDGYEYAMVLVCEGCGHTYAEQFLLGGPDGEG